MSMRLAGVVGLSPDDPRRTSTLLRGVAFYDSHAALFAANPDINLVVELGSAIPPRQLIADMGFPGYFLIVQDFINWAKDHGIPVGPGRGSAAGSLVAYSLRITNLDPLPYDLLFERFLNIERVSMEL